MIPYNLWFIWCLYTYLAILVENTYKQRMFLSRLILPVWLPQGCYSMDTPIAIVQKPYSRGN